MKNRRKWNYTLSLIAEFVDKSVHTVRDDRRSGKFDPDDLGSVCDYVTAHRLMNGDRNGDREQE